MADETVFQKAPQQEKGPIDFEYLRSLTNAPPMKEMEEDEKEEDKPQVAENSMKNHFNNWRNFLK